MHGTVGDRVWTAQGSLGCEKEQRRKGGETEHVFRLKGEDRGGGLRRSWEESDNRPRVQGLRLEQGRGNGATLAGREGG